MLDEDHPRSARGSGFDRRARQRDGRKERGVFGKRRQALSRKNEVRYKSKNVRQFTIAYSVFVSHGWHDRWVAQQIAIGIRGQTGTEVFIDIFDIKSGDRIEEKVHAGLSGCSELISLLTPWSVDRN
ncbi:MAG: hypothetical protein DLM68_16225 [Hyphomicrobiales bacterium]|nr:MAG: hypothetical protein DLM68_16225 [Hyphomicrobiales bacterium]